MTLFNFGREKVETIDFSDEKVERLSNLTDQLGDILIKSGFGFYVDYLSQVRLSAEKRDKEKFKKLAISVELFGGAGALWEIWIEDNQLRVKFEQQFCRFVDQLKEMGIKNGRVDQVRNGFNIR
jgi:hypothetical protein